VAVQGNPDTARPIDEIVDVLIIGAGASCAAVAWRLAETRMKIPCLEQGDWIKPTEFPTNGRYWEARRERENGLPRRKNTEPVLRAPPTPWGLPLGLDDQTLRDIGFRGAEFRFLVILGSSGMQGAGGGNEPNRRMHTR